MKIFFSLLLTLGMATPALAQGKVNFQNNSLHLVYWGPGELGSGRAYVLGDGTAVLTIELWAGTSSTALSLQATTDFSGQSSPGTWIGRTLVMPTVPAGLTYFDIYIYDVTAGSFWNAELLARVHGTSGLFTAVASGGTAYYSLVQHNSPALSTWADGTWNLDSVSPGFRGAIELVTLPEPSSCALACLGCALLLLRRRAETMRVQKLN
jgi:hypothetical protein